MGKEEILDEIFNCFDGVAMGPGYIGACNKCADLIISEKINTAKEIYDVKENHVNMIACCQRIILQNSLFDTAKVLQ